MRLALFVRCSDHRAAGAEYVVAPDLSCAMHLRRALRAAAEARP